jgi:hypothetical protein
VVRVEVQRAADGRVVAISAPVERDADVRFRDDVRALDTALAGPGHNPIESVSFEPNRAIAWRAVPAASFSEPRALLDALAFLDPVARVLGIAHGRGVGHGSLSPQRIGVMNRRGVVVDLVAAATMGLPRAPAYSTPEQLDERAADAARCDVYALALLFIAAVSGRSPWIDERELYVRAIDRHRRPSLAALGIAAAPAIDRVLERALNVDPELRFANADAFWSELRSVVLAAPGTEPEPPLPRTSEPPVEKRDKPPRAPTSIVIGASVLLITAGFGIEAILRAVRKPVVAPPPVVATAAPSPAPSPTPSVAAPAPPPPPPADMVAVSDALLVDRTEVTVKSYRACVVAGACKETHKRASGWNATDPVRKEWLCNYHRPGRDDHPINCISLHQAAAYCAFAGKRLPTGEEWTRAARGDESRKYPWGDSAPRCKEVAFARYGPDNPGCNKQPVGTQSAEAHPKTASPYGALDMGGSLWEWTTDVSPRGLPIMRGGAWDCSETGVTIESRLEQSPTNADITLGFRCVK